MSYLASFRASKANSILQTLLRVLQFLSAVISLGLFSARLSKILRHARGEYTAADGAVEGILAAASLYSLVATALKVGIRRGNPGWLRWLLVLLDLLFVGAFIAVAVLTRPSGGPAGPGGGACRRLSRAGGRVLPSSVRDRMNCRLPWGSFILAIISTLLHAATAAFHEVRDHHRRRDSDREVFHNGPGSPVGKEKKRHHKVPIEGGYR